MQLFADHVAPAPARSRTARIAVADDDPDLRTIVADALRADGHEVVEASDVEELLSILEPLLIGEEGSGDVRERRPPPDLVVSDVRMARGVTGIADGIGILALLRTTPRYVPVILMTGFGDADVHRNVEELGGFLVDKPFDLDDLRGRARALLAMSR
jgi:CheY-like chemotaxis protein